MKPNTADQSLQPPQYEIIQEAVLQILAEYSDGITVDRLAHKVFGSLATESHFSPKRIKDYVQRIAFDLKTASMVEALPDTEPIQIRLLKRDRETLMDATRRGYTAIVERSLEGKIEPETKDAALISAVINNHPEIVRLLIEAGADVNARESLFNKTALMYVTNRTSKEIERFLREAGAKG